jgi:hypothetical protein
MRQSSELPDPSRQAGQSSSYVPCEKQSATYVEWVIVLVQASPTLKVFLDELPLFDEAEGDSISRAADTNYLVRLKKVSYSLFQLCGAAVRWYCEQPLTTPRLHPFLPIRLFVALFDHCNKTLSQQMSTLRTRSHQQCYLFQARETRSGQLSFAWVHA